MNNLQFSLSIGLPVLFILTGIFFNWSAANSLRAEIGGLRDKLEDVKDSNHKDALEMMRQMTALHERVAIVESKQR